MQRDISYESNLQGNMTEMDSGNRTNAEEVDDMLPEVEPLTTKVNTFVSSPPTPPPAPPPKQKKKIDSDSNSEDKLNKKVSQSTPPPRKIAVPQTVQPTDMTVIAAPPKLISPTSTAEIAVERTATGIPIRLIWLPYVGLSLVMIGLMCLSFFHYHKKNGHKYRRRREELVKQFNMQDILTQFQGTNPSNGGFNISPENPPLTPQPPVNPYHHRPPKLNPHFQPSSAATEQDALYPVKRKTHSEEQQQHQQPQEKPQRQSLFRQISAPTGAGISKTQKKQPAYSPRGVPLVTVPSSKPNNAPPITSTTTSSSRIREDEILASTSSTSQHHPSQPQRRHKRPLVFTSNLNGSMVDIRCGVNESHKTFHSKSNRSTSLPTSAGAGTCTSIWTLPPIATRAPQLQHHHHPHHTIHEMQEHNYQYPTYPPPASHPAHPSSSQSYYHHPPPHQRQPISQYQHQYSYPPTGLPSGGSTPHRQQYSDPVTSPYSPSSAGIGSLTSDCEDDEVFLLHQTKL